LPELHKTSMFTNTDVRSIENAPGRQVTEPNADSASKRNGTVSRLQSNLKLHTLSQHLIVVVLVKLVANHKQVGQREYLLPKSFPLDAKIGQLQATAHTSNALIFRELP